MKYGNYRDGFFLPNELFQLGLDYGELAVYSFLKRCENRKTHQCWPSIKTIGEAVGMSENTVRKYIRQLEERGLITTEPTEVITKSSGRRNGNLLFTLRPTSAPTTLVCSSPPPSSLTWTAAGTTGGAAVLPGLPAGGGAGHGGRYPRRRLSIQRRGSPPPEIRERAKCEKDQRPCLAGAAGTWGLGGGR